MAGRTGSRPGRPSILIDTSEVIATKLCRHQTNPPPIVRDRSRRAANPPGRSPAPVNPRSQRPLLAVARLLGFDSWKELVVELGDDDRPCWNPESDVRYISRAAAEASKLHHGYVGIDHLLLALLNPPEPTKALDVLGALGISYADQLDKVKKWNRPRRKQGRSVNPALQQLLGRSEGIAIAMGSAEVRDEHALLAILYAGDDRRLSTLDPDDIAAVMGRFGVALPGTLPPVLGSPLGPWGPWVYVRRDQLSEVTRKLAELHPPGTLLWGMNKSKWKRDYWYVHGDDAILMEAIVRSVVPEPNDIEVLSIEEGARLENAGAPRRYRDRPRTKNI